VELHAAHGYLLAEFLSPVLNRRQDEWGGTTEGRARIVLEIVRRARQVVGDYPILIKISAYDCRPGGMTAEESVRLAGIFSRAFLDAIEVSCGNDDFMCTVRAPKMPVAAILALEPTLRQAGWLKKRLAALMIPLVIKTHPFSENYNLAAAEKIKAGTDLPVILVGGVRKYSAMSEIIAQGKADYVSLCRPFIIEPELVHKLQTGKKTESGCINCNYCLIGITDNPLKCYYGKVPAVRR
jgi:2,4-dienoyl-CoA reductase-like NADH-dependent reductase (Old Yellow Enzyme family)